MKENFYKQIRQTHSLSREAVSIESNDLISQERLERIENGKFSIHPDEVLLLSKIYKEPFLCNYYCSNECPIGNEYVPEIKTKDLSQIVLEIIHSLNIMKQRQDRLVEITADGIIADDELADFVGIQNALEYISATVLTLQLWVEKMIAEEKINIEQLNALNYK